LRGALRNPASAVMELPIAAPELCGLAGERVAWPVEVPALHMLIEKQVRETPDRIALSFDDGFLTYRDLNRQAEKIAHALRRQGVVEDDVVAVSLDRSAELLIVLFGILKAGASYLPVGTDYPR